MTQYTDLKVSHEAWTDIHTELGISAGTTIYVQNIGPTAVRIYTGASAPSGSPANIGLYVNPTNKSGDSSQQLAQIEPGGSNKAFAISVNSISNGVISVQD